MIIEQKLLNTTQIESFLYEIKKKSDKAINYFLIGFFLLGLVLARFYDTSMVAVGVGSLALMAYYSAKWLLPASDLYQYVLGAVFGIFMAQYIYEMHGLFEMHFIAFIGSALLITYQNWKLQIPLALVVFGHHALFAYLQYAGYDHVYFTQLDYMGLQTFIIHISLAILIFFICGLWAYQFRKYSAAHIAQSYEIGKLQEGQAQKEALQHSERNLAEANRELNMLFNNVDEVLFSIDILQGQVTQMSSASEKVYGYKPEEFISEITLWRQIVHPEDAQIIEKQFGLVQKGQEAHNQYRIIHKDQTIRWIENTVIPTMDHSGKLVRLDGVTRDITDRKKAESEVIALNESLEQKVNERTAELTQVNKELEAFSYSVSHDLRAPLRVIDGFGRILRETEELTEDGKESLDAILKNASQMGFLIDDLLSFSRLGRTPVTKKPVHMTDMVETVVGEVKTFYQNSKVDISLDGLTNTTCDPVLIKQVWVNIISNAVKYSRKKEKPKVEIGMEKSDAGLVYYVRDNGAGFDMKYANKLFTVFQRLHKVTEYEGTGIGLALVYRIITKHGGRIWADAKVDEGATFYFTLSENN